MGQALNNGVKLREVGPVMPLFAGPREIQVLPLRDVGEEVEEVVEEVDQMVPPEQQERVLSEVESWPEESRVLFFK